MPRPTASPAQDPPSGGDQRWSPSGRTRRRATAETLEAPFHPDPRDGRDPVVHFSGADVHATFRWNGAYGLHVEIRWLPLEAAVEVADVLKRFEGNQVPAHQVHMGG